MIKQVAMDVEAAEGDKLRIRYCNDFELSGGDDSVQPAVDLIVVGERDSARRPVDELALIEQCKKAGGMFRATRAKLNALRARTSASRRPETGCCARAASRAKRLQKQASSRRAAAQRGRSPGRRAPLRPCRRDRQTRSRRSRACFTTTAGSRRSNGCGANVLRSSQAGTGKLL
jgi:hypothetical protein